MTDDAPLLTADVWQQFLGCCKCTPCTRVSNQNP